MSTKIYAAYRFNGKANELLEHLRAYRPKWHKFQVSRLAGFVQIPNHAELVKQIREQSEKALSSWDALFDVRGSVVVYFHGSKIYLQTFMQTQGEPPELIDERFEDFHYQNQTDPWYEMAKEISANDKAAAKRNWRLRKKTWDAIFAGNFSSPVEAGVTYSFCGCFDYSVIAREVCDLIKAKQ